MDEIDEGGFKAPWMSFQTFWNFLGELCSKPLPPALDRSIMQNKSGTDQSNLMSALETFRLIDPEGEVRTALQTFADCGPEDRKELLREWLTAHYAAPLEVSANNGTPNDLNTVFRDQMGIASSDTRRKAITFFLHAAQEAGIPLSPHFPKTRTGSGAPGAPRKRTTTKKKASKGEVGANGDQKQTQSGGGHTQTITLNSGGTVSLTYNVNMFEIDDSDEEFVLGLIKKLRKYPSREKPKKTSLGVSSSQDGAAE